MSVRHEAQVHVEKAREFLEVAVECVESRHFNAVASNAVISGINSKDAICLHITGLTNKKGDHLDAVDELRRSVSGTRDLASCLSRLISLKSKSQYQTVAISESDARKAVVWAQRLLDGAVEVVSS